MILKPALVAMVASGLMTPEGPKPVLSKPAIVRAASLDFSKHMLLGMPLTMGMLPKASASAVSVINRGVLASASNDASSYTFSSYNIGAATSTRRVIVVAMGCRGDAGGRRISSITVNGVSATIDHQAFDDNGSGGVELVTIASATVTSGSSVSIVTAYSGSMSRACVYAVSVDGLQSPTPVYTSGVGNNVSPHSYSASLQAGGFVIGGAGTDADGTTITWTNITERVEAAVEAAGSRYGAADDLTTATETKSISVAIASGARRVSAIASYK